MPFLHRYVGTPVITFLTSRAERAQADQGQPDRLPGLPPGRDAAASGLVGNGMELASEMLIKSARADLRIGNIEGGYSPRIGESKLDTWSDGWRHLKLILLLAPDIVLIGPGLTLAVARTAGAGARLRAALRLEIGSARWQPVFFSGIALVLGLQMFFAGAVVATLSPVARSGRERLSVPPRPAVAPTGGRPRPHRRAARAAHRRRAVHLVAARRRPDPTTGVGFGFASLAQTLLDPRRIVGGLRRLAASPGVRSGIRTPRSEPGS